MGAEKSYKVAVTSVRRLLHDQGQLSSRYQVAIGGPSSLPSAHDVGVGGHAVCGTLLLWCRHGAVCISTELFSSDIKPQNRALLADTRGVDENRPPLSCRLQGALPPSRQSVAVKTTHAHHACDLRLPAGASQTTLSDGLERCSLAHLQPLGSPPLVRMGLCSCAGSLLTASH